MSAIGKRIEKGRGLLSGRTIRVLSVSVILLLFSHSEGAVLAGAADTKPYFTDKGQLHYARLLMDGGEYRAAVREYSRLIEVFPASPLVPEAQLGLSQACIRAGLYGEARRNLLLFVSNFPESTLLFEARGLLKEASVKMEGGGGGGARAGEAVHTVARPDVDTPIRAVQVSFFEGKGFGEIEREFRRMRKAGVNTVIVRVFHNEGDRAFVNGKGGAGPKGSGVYFRTTHSPVVEDVLGPLTRMAHRNGLMVFAWMTTRHADYGVKGGGGLMCRAYDLTQRGFAPCAGLDLFNEDAIGHLEALFSDLARNDIDGILLQDDLVSRHNEGFGPYASALFRDETGMELSPEALYARVEGTQVHYTPLFWKWASWKNRHLLRVAARLRDAARRVNPEVRFAINLMYESVTNAPYALAWLSQSLDESVRTGFDYYAVMAYHKQMEGELERDPAAVKAMIGNLVKDAVAIVGDPNRVLVKLQTVDFGTGEPLPDGEVVDLLRDMKTVNGLSIAVFPYRRDFPFHELGGAGYASLN